MSIATVEDAFITETQAALPDRLRTVATMPGALNADNLRELVRGMPGVWFAFLGGSEGSNGHMDDWFQINARFGMYVATSHASGHDARRRGRGADIGAYEILQTVLPRIHGRTVTGVGVAQVKRVENLFSLRLERDQAAAMYAAIIEVPLTWSPDDEIEGMDDFALYHAEHSLAPGDDEPDAIDNVAIPTE